MYVLMDLEWFCTRRGNILPTQLAALRVDESWRELDRFFSRIKPDCTDTPDWIHMAFSGGKPEDFLRAPTLSTVLRNFRSWLQKDDVLCWWAEEAPEIFKRLHTPLLQTPPAVPHRVLLDHVSPALTSRDIAQKNPYKIAASLGLTVPTPAHCSEHDVQTIQAVLQALDFPPGKSAQPGQAADKPLRFQAGPCPCGYALSVRRRYRTSAQKGLRRYSGRCDPVRLYHI